MSVREDLKLALHMLDDVLDKPFPNLTEQELQFIREKRVNEVARYALQLQREIVKVHSRNAFVKETP